jgi:hypothetical protein
MEREPFPLFLSGNGKLSSASNGHIYRYVLVASGLAGLFLMILFLSNIGQFRIPKFTTSVSSGLKIVPTTGKISIAINPVQPATSQPKLTPTTNVTPSPTLTIFSPQKHALETPIKVDNHIFLIHLALDGEGFDYLVKTFETTIDVIRSLNYLLPPAIWVNLPIVISPGLDTVDPALPEFQAYKVKDTEISIEDLAKILDVDPELLRHYNACLSGCSLVNGDWLIIPYKK